MVVLEPRACPAPSPRGGGTPQAQSRRFHTNVRREKAMIFPSVCISMFRAKRAPPEASRETAIASSHRAELGRVSAPKPATGPPGPPGPPGLTQTHPAEAGGIRHTRESEGRVWRPPAACHPTHCPASDLGNSFIQNSGPQAV